MTDKLSKNDLIDLAYMIVKIEGPLKGIPQEMSYAEATKKLFHGKPKRWVTRYILAKYPETWSGPDAWITKPQGKGHPIKLQTPRLLPLGYSSTRMRLIGPPNTQRR